MYNYNQVHGNYNQIPVNYNDDRFLGGFLGPFLLGGITGGLAAPLFYNNGCNCPNCCNNSNHYFYPYPVYYNQYPHYYN